VAEEALRHAQTTALAARKRRSARPDGGVEPCREGRDRVVERGGAKRSTEVWLAGGRIGQLQVLSVVLIWVHTDSPENQPPILGAQGRGSPPAPAAGPSRKAVGGDSPTCASETSNELSGATVCTRRTAAESLVLI
jgi:hypothetical protein